MADRHLSSSRRKRTPALPLGSAPLRLGCDLFTTAWEFESHMQDFSARERNRGLAPNPAFTPPAPQAFGGLLGPLADLHSDAQTAEHAAAAATDVLMRAEILSYSRSRGLFAGISLEGSTLRQDNSANHKLYGRELSAREIVSGKVGVPAAGQEMVATLRKHSPRNLSDPKSLGTTKSKP